ncbi:ornithine cyclodeaminase [Mesorhizobium soli]|uniref:ornithine cyclodeaminase family protein n=1 Tax=Pseudaminobacter soli (ex Li et al. 2025) TaxID=1295366 RepID=UPI0024750CCD|nr:saccharopine dehydrogenase NADP-binding domain-containing protein [Mesorhizobium soli]MDH6233120.1 ornithine cyclodeaminase [Mesorhizobium soli]
MATGFPILTLEDIVPLCDPSEITKAVQDALIRHAQGKTVSPPPVQLEFPEAQGDCHIKTGYFRGDRYFAVKVATGFYANPSRGLPVNDGVTMVFDTHTGTPVALLRDAGWLTSWRTAAAGALAAAAGAPPGACTLGIVGTGHQAQLQAEWIAEHLNMERIVVWGRSADRAEALASALCAKGLTAVAVASIQELCAETRLIVTCTPSASAVVPTQAVQAGTHIVAVGADSPGKQELEPSLFARASVIAVDDREQCLHHGETSHALRERLLVASDVVLLGDILAGRAKGRLSADEVTITDLTGIAAQDVAMASLVLEKMQCRRDLDR